MKQNANLRGSIGRILRRRNTQRPPAIRWSAGRGNVCDDACMVSGRDGTSTATFGAGIYMEGQACSLRALLHTAGRQYRDSTDNTDTTHAKIPPGLGLFASRSLFLGSGAPLGNGQIITYQLVESRLQTERDGLRQL